MAGAVTQPAVAAIGIFQFLKDQMKQVIKFVPAQQAQSLADLPRALCFAVDAIKDSIHQASLLALLLSADAQKSVAKALVSRITMQEAVGWVPLSCGTAVRDDILRKLLPVKRKSRHS